MCGPLCEAVTGEGDGDTMLADLQRANLFIVPLDDAHHWYRYHHLFADLSGNLLRKALPPERILELHCRASRWYEGQGSSEEAIKHALLAEDFEGAGPL